MGSVGGPQVCVWVFIHCTCGGSRLIPEIRPTLVNGAVVYLLGTVKSQKASMAAWQGSSKAEPGDAFAVVQSPALLALISTCRLLRGLLLFVQLGDIDGNFLMNHLCLLLGLLTLSFPRNVLTIQPLLLLGRHPYLGLLECLPYALEAVTQVNIPEISLWGPDSKTLWAHLPLHLLRTG